MVKKYNLSQMNHKRRLCFITEGKVIISGQTLYFVIGRQSSTRTPET